jgi:hypothetical protein
MALQTDDVIAASQKMRGLFVGDFVAECVSIQSPVLGIADLLARGPCTIATLASATSCHAFSLQRVLRILVRFVAFSEPEPGRFELAPFRPTLRSDDPASLRDAAIFVMSARYGRPRGRFSILCVAAIPHLAVYMMRRFTNRSPAIQNWDRHFTGS